MASRDGILIFSAVFLLFIVLTNDYYVENDLSRMATIESIVEGGTFIIDEASVKPLVDKVFVGGHYYSSKPPMLSLIGAIPYFMLSAVGVTFRSHASLAYYIVTLSVMGSLTSLLAVLFYRSLLYYGLTVRQGIVLTGLLVTATPLMNYTVTYNNHTPAAALIFASFYLILDSKNGGVLRLFLAGLASGLAAGIDIPPGLVFGVVFIGYIIFDGGLRGKAHLFVIGMLLPLTLHAYLNVMILGDLKPAQLHPEYYRYPGSGFKFTEDGIDPVDVDQGDVSRLTYILNSLFGVQGFFSNTPMHLFSAAVIVSEVLRKKRKTGREVLFLGSGCAMLFIFYLTSTSGYGGIAYSFRWLVPTTPILAYLSKSFLEEGRSMWAYLIFLLTALTSVFIGLINLLAVNSPWTSYPFSDYAGIIIVSFIMSVFTLSNKIVRDMLLNALKP
ncbi:MAG: hypothetical protein ABIH11_02615 [Candidatus Altiarchaeota archaeon]